MSKGVYVLRQPRAARRKHKIALIAGGIIAALLLLLFFGLVYKQTVRPATTKASVQFDASVTDAEKQIIHKARLDHNIGGKVKVSVGTTLEVSSVTSLLAAYVPVTNVYATKQAITKDEVATLTVHIPKETNPVVQKAIAQALGVENSKLEPLPGSLEELDENEVAFIPVDQLSPQVKLLAFNGSYYLDNFQNGAVFRQTLFSGGSAAEMQKLSLNNLPSKDTTLKTNMTGVTALTRVMMRKLNTVKDPKYFSEKIGDFLADADITHVSNEVSFMDNCQYNDVAFCAPPETIETLKASGVDVVELTGNHNNDKGSEYNTQTIEKYHTLGWHTFGGGINSTEAAKPYITDKKQSKVAFLGYNYADSPNGGSIAGASKAGANSFDFDKIKSDIKKAKQEAGFVIVDIQFWECYSYPNGYIEFPECDLPISGQAETFRKVADLGADMVVGTQAHQPQTYEIYKGTPIYYGLGNLYFDQTQWPGTERGIILSHYFVKGKLLQTKLSPTVYDQALQTRLMDDTQAAALLDRLKTARESSLL